MRSIKLKKTRVCYQGLVLAIVTLFTAAVAADVAGSWDFAVSLGQLGSGNAAVTLNADSDGKLTGTYSGQLGETEVSGSVQDGNFEFRFASELIGTDVVYRGSEQENGNLTGVVILQGQEAGTFTGTRN